MACHDSALADDPCQKKKSRSIQEDANHIDEEEKPAVVLPERGLWDDVVGEDADDIGDDTEDALNDLACDESALTDKPCEKKKSRSIDDASHTDDEEKPAVVLPKRDYIHDIWMTIKCASEEDFEDRCGCPGVYC